MSFSPISERVIPLDAIRGIAIFGMFTVNMTADVFWSDDFAELPTDSLDFAALVLVSLFTNCKYITLFSFLFGIGFFVQTQRRLEADLGATRSVCISYFCKSWINNGYSSTQSAHKERWVNTKA